MCSLSPLSNIMCNHVQIGFQGMLIVLELLNFLNLHCLGIIKMYKKPVILGMSLNQPESSLNSDFIIYNLIT